MASLPPTDQLFHILNSKIDMISQQIIPEITKVVKEQIRSDMTQSKNDIVNELKEHLSEKRHHDVISITNEVSKQVSSKIKRDNQQAMDDFREKFLGQICQNI